MVLGLDVGSCYTKGLLFDDGVEGKVVVKTSFKPEKAVEEITVKLSGYDGITATGYGRKFVDSADQVITEITAFAKGAAFIDSSVRTIIDIGGQDSKVIKLRESRVERFVMNDRCAAGTGNFIEKTAQALDLSLEEFGHLAVNSKKPEMIDSLCVVMAETEILSLVAEDKKIEDITAGVCDAVVRRLIGIGEQIGIEEPVLLCGGGAMNPGLVKAMEQTLGKVNVPDDPQFVGALGAAVIGSRSKP